MNAHDRDLPAPAPPVNVDVEQALLGAILVNNEAYYLVSGFLAEKHFSEPLHAEIYRVMARAIGLGLRINAMNLIQRHRFDILTDTGGDWSDTGGPVWGAILQTQYVAADTGDVLDTGADLTIKLRPDPGDTGSDMVVAVDNNVLGSSFHRVYKQATYDTGGTVTSEEFFFAAGARLQVTVNQSAGVTGQKRGTLYIISG